MHRSVAKIIFWLHDHMPRAHNIHVMYNFEHHSSQVAAEWGVCVVIADVRHTVKNVCFSTIVQKLLTLLFSPFTQTWLTIWPSKKHKSHTDINLKKFNPFCPLSLHTFWHLVILTWLKSLDFSLHFQSCCLPQVWAEACISLQANWEQVNSLNCPSHVRQTKSSIKKRIIVHRTVWSMFGEQTFAQLRMGLTVAIWDVLSRRYVQFKKNVHFSINWWCCDSDTVTKSAKVKIDIHVTKFYQPDRA